MCNFYEILYRWWWNRKFKKVPLRKQNGYAECFDIRQARYNKMFTVPIDTPNIGFDNTFDNYAHAKNFMIR